LDFSMARNATKRTENEPQSCCGNRRGVFHALRSPEGSGRTSDPRQQRHPTLTASTTYVRAIDRTLHGKGVGRGQRQKSLLNESSIQVLPGQLDSSSVGVVRLTDVKTVAVEEWLGKLSLAAGTKAKLRNIMSATFNHAIRHEWLDKNPISLVRQSAKRETIPTVLDAAEISALLTELQHPYRQMVFLAATTGLRASELLALKWCDINFESLEICLDRGVVHQVVGDLKTETSRKPLPLDPDLAHSLLVWRRTSPYNQEHDWVFASPEMQGKQPYWPENLLRRHIRPGAKRCGINKPIGWHTFRHSYATHLKANGEDVKVVQESLRHANSRITLDTYTQALTPAKREAQTKVVRMILPERNQTAAAGGGK